MSEATANEKYLLDEIQRERARADRSEAEFCACKALLIAEQKRAERAEAERAEARALAPTNVLDLLLSGKWAQMERDGEVYVCRSQVADSLRALAALPVEPARETTIADLAAKWIREIPPTGVDYFAVVAQLQEVAKEAIWQAAIRRTRTFSTEAAPVPVEPARRQGTEITQEAGTPRAPSAAEIRALEALRALRQQVEDTIGAAQTDSDADDWITAYHFKTGAIHRLLAKAREPFDGLGVVYQTAKAASPPGGTPNRPPDLICDNCKRASKAKDGRTDRGFPIGPCYCDTLRGAASRSEQSACPEPPCGDGPWCTCAPEAHEKMRRAWRVQQRAEQIVAAEAAQSPQVGAARCQCGDVDLWPEWAGARYAGRCHDRYECHPYAWGGPPGGCHPEGPWLTDPTGEWLRSTVPARPPSAIFVNGIPVVQCPHVQYPGLLLPHGAYCMDCRGDGHGFAFALPAEPGRSVSGRPPAAVASADPELAKLLRDVRAWFAEEAESGTSTDAWLWRERIDSALSRLAGQSATANENASGAAARGLPEHLRNHLLYVHPQPWRVGSKVARNVYDAKGEGVAMFTHAHTAAIVVAAVNSFWAEPAQSVTEPAPKNPNENHD